MNWVLVVNAIIYVTRAKMIFVLDDSIAIDNKEIRHMIKTKEIEMVFLAKHINTNFSRILDGDLKNIDLFSFSRNCAFLNAMIVSKEIRHFKFSASSNRLKDVTQSEGEARLCIDYTYSYKLSIVSLIRNLHMKKVAFVVYESFCTKICLEFIQKELKNSFIFTSVTFRSNQTSGLNEFFYSLSVDIIKLIVLISPQEFFHAVFINAQKYNLMHTVWIIPNFKMVPFAFTRVISFQEKLIKERSYSELDQFLLHIIRNFKDIEAKCFRSKSCISSHLYEKLISSYICPLPFRLNITENFHSLNGGIAEVVTEAEFKHEMFTIHANNASLFHSSTVINDRKHIRVVTILDPPFVYELANSYDNLTKQCLLGIICKKEQSIKNTTTCCIGFGISLFSAIMQDLTFEIEMYIAKDSKYGGRLSGEWNGLIGDVVNGKADIALAALSITKERSEVVQFTLPILSQETGILTKPKNDELSFLNWNYLSPLSGNLQLVLWFIIISVIGINYLIENCTYAMALYEKIAFGGRYYPLMESLSYIGGVTLQRDIGGGNPAKLGARVCAIVYAFAMVILVTTYTAQLAAQSVYQVEKNPFKGSKDPKMRNPTSAYTFAVVKSSSYEDYFLKSSVDEVRRMGVFMEKYNVETTTDGINEVKDETLQAFIDDYWFLFWHASRDKQCKLRLIKDTIAKGSTGFALQKNSELLPLINNAIMRIQEQDEITALQDKWFYKFCQPDFLNKKTIAFGITHFGGIIMVLLMTIAASFPMLMSEGIIYKRSMKNKVIIWLQDWLIHAKLHNANYPQERRSVSAGLSSGRLSASLVPKVTVDRLGVIRFP